MLTTGAIFYISQDNRKFQIHYVVSDGITTIFSNLADYGESLTRLYSASFICDDRKAAEIFLLAFLNHEKRKL